MIHRPGVVQMRGGSAVWRSPLCVYAVGESRRGGLGAEQDCMRACTSCIFPPFFSPIVSTGHTRAHQPGYSPRSSSPPPLGTVRTAPPCATLPHPPSRALFPPVGPVLGAWLSAYPSTSPPPCAPGSHTDPAAALRPRMTRHLAPATRSSPVSPTAWPDSRSEKASRKRKRRKWGEKKGRGKGRPDGAGGGISAVIWCPDRSVRCVRWSDWVGRRHSVPAALAPGVPIAQFLEMSSSSRLA